MISNFMVGLVFAVGLGAWVYSKTMRNSGNNTNSALVVAGITAALGFLVFFALISALDNFLSR